MSGADLTVFYVVVGVALGVWAGAVFFIPSCFGSLFRYRLWQLRDDLFDLMLEDKLQGVEDETLELLARIEETIVHSRQVTMFNLLAALSIFSDTLEVKDSGPEPTSKPAARLENLEHRFATTFLRKVLFGSPSGWLGLVIAALVLSVFAIRAGMLPHTFARKKAAEISDKLITEQRLDTVLWEDEHHQTEEHERMLVASAG